MDVQVHTVGPNYHVWKNNKWVPAEIHHLKLVHATWPEYRVHYINKDSRWDEWVSAERIKSHPSIGNSTQSSLHVSSGVSISEAVRHLQRRQRNEEIERETRIRSLNPLNQQALNYKDRVVHSIQFGMYDLTTWYPSKYVDPYGRADHLYVCEFCCKYMIFRKAYCRHLETCSVKNPPGTPIYHKGDIAVWEVDGEQERSFCQNLGLVSKLFIKNKGLVYSTQYFYYYVVCEAKGNKWGIAAYFSKDKCLKEYNLSCILTFPHYRKTGIGAFMIQMSYEISRRQGRVGKPEKPLSVLGQRSYTSYWVYAILKALRDAPGKCFTESQLSAKTFIAEEDIRTAMNTLELQPCRGKSGHYYLETPSIEAYFKKLDENAVHWKVIFDEGHFTWETGSRNRRPQASNA